MTLNGESKQNSLEWRMRWALSIARAIRAESGSFTASSFLEITRAELGLTEDQRAAIRRKVYQEATRGTMYGSARRRLNSDDAIAELKAKSFERSWAYLDSTV